MSGKEASALIEKLWAQFGPVVEQRLAALDAGLDALAGGEGAADARVRDAHAAAHSLAGALGTYGRTAAGVTAREVMTALEQPRPDAAAVRALVARLREQIR